MTDAVMPTVTPPPLSIGSLASYVANPSQPPPYANQPSADQTVQDSLNFFTNPNSQYMQQAKQQGMDYAATRGGLNSSIAAGASERSAMQAAQPLMSEALGIQQQRDQLAGQDWLSSQGFNRQIQGALTMLPITSAYHMLDTVQNYALQNPALYTPDVISGYSNFFNDNMNNVMNQLVNTNSSSAAPGG